MRRPSSIGVAILGDHRIGLVQRDHARGPSSLRIQRRVPGCWRDPLVHQRLRDHRLVGFVVAVAAEAHEVDEHVLVELLAEVECEFGGQQSTASGSSPLTCKIGASTILATSVQYSVERVSRGSDVVKPIWLLTTMWTVPPVLIAARLRHVQHFLIDALAGNRRIAVDQHRQHLVALAVAAAVLARTHRCLRPPG